LAPGKLTDGPQYKRKQTREQNIKRKNKHIKGEE
jgi:hypothetical protein